LPSASQMRIEALLKTVSQTTSLPVSSDQLNSPAPLGAMLTHLAPSLRQAVTARCGLSRSQRYCSGLPLKTSDGPRAQKLALLRICSAMARCLASRAASGMSLLGPASLALPGSAALRRAAPMSAGTVKQRQASAAPNRFIAFSVNLGAMSSLFIEYRG